ncbi:hypothetical protein OAV67_01055 [Alphaproteobacteria bacterium]|nr:hypothetical protein [Alphaproteobacteria bacterium]
MAKERAKKKSPQSQIERLWSEVLETKSVGYLLRAKIEQNLALLISNINSSFMGNRQLANQNTEDVYYTLRKIIESRVDDNGDIDENLLFSLNTDFIEHRSKLNRRINDVSAELNEVNNKLLSIHRKVMKANDEIIKFNTKNLEATYNFIMDSDSKADAKTLRAEDFDKKCAALSKQNKQNNKNTAKLMEIVNEALENTIDAQAQVLEKRERIFENRKVIMGIRKDIDLFTDD